ncbi:MAG: tetratricopeptide repeat protein [Candidatus Eisenbacteria bacterium]|nr:tetratricopeptide repeat protein [Candidatus Latescibacterota bacterium]MBD3300858.1 tetratricopeptide repeat protein [Candidatus Eisenbacteria bacterium]
MNRNQLLLGAAALLLITILAHFPALDAGFIWDDDAYVTENETLWRPGGLERIWLDPSATSQYYPLVYTTFWIEHRLWGLEPLGYHVVNVLLHAAVAFLLWLSLSRLGIGPAWLAAAVFAVHPVHVESVAWITERKNVLSGIFYFSSFLLFVRACRPFRSEPEPVRWQAYVLSLLLFLCALWSKTVTSTLPAAILLLVWWKRGTISKRIVALTVPHFVLGAALAGVTIWVERHEVGAHGAEWSRNLIERTLLAGKAIWIYISKLLAPVDLAFIYPKWEVDQTAWAQYLFPLAFLAALFLLWRVRDRIGRGPLVAVLFFAGTLLPALGFINIYLMRYSFVADHFQYLPSVGILVLVVCALHALIQRFGPIDRRVVRGLAGALLVVLGIATFARASVFRDAETLWLDTLSKNPDAWMAHHNLAMVYEGQGRFEESLERYRRSIELRPDLSQSYFNLGTLLARNREWEAAQENFEKAIDREPGYVDAHVHLANVLYTQGMLEEAVDRYHRAVAIDPNKLSAYKNLSVALIRLGRWTEAVEATRNARRLDPTDPETAHRLARLLATAPDEAVRDGEKAVQLAESLSGAIGHRHGPYLVTLAAAYAEAGRFDRAVATIDRAIEKARGAGMDEVLPDLEAARERYREGKPTRME